MFSKRAVQAVIGATALVVALAGCDSKVGETPPPPTSREFGGTQCLSAVRPVVAAFVQGEAQPRDIEASWECARSALEKFKRYVRGRTSDRYSAQELSKFLEDNFLDDEKITPVLQTEFMKVKQLFIGGSAESLTRDEIDKLAVLFRNFSDISVRINPYMKVLVLNWSALRNSKVFEQSEYFEQANIEIQNAARSVAALIEQNGRGYVLADFVTLTKELGAFVGESWELPHTLETYMPLVQKVKKALAGGEESTIAPQEWARFLLLGSRGYVQYLRYYYFIKSVPETGMAYRLSYLAASADDLLSMFQDFVAEKPGQRVTTEELGEFLKTLGAVWPTFKTSDKLLLESMKVKQLLFGGDFNQFTTRDFENARGKVGKIKAVTERFLPYYPVYAGEWDPSYHKAAEAERYFNEAQKALEDSAQAAAGLFETSYDLKDLLSLLEEVQRLYPPESGEELAPALKKYIPLVLDTKNMIFGTNDSVLHKQHWPILASLGSRLYGDYLYYHYFVQDKPADEVATMLAMSKFSNQTLNLVKELISQKKEGYFSKTELSKIISHLVKLEFLPDSFTPDVVTKILDVVLNRVLVSPERRLKGYSPNVLNASAIEVARQELQIWLDTQTWILDLTKDFGPNDGIRASRMVEFLNTAKASRSSSAPLKIGAGELLLAVSSPVAMTFDKEGRLNISSRRGYAYNARSLSQLNFNRVVARVLLRSFVNSSQRLAAYSGATLPEMEAAFKSLRPVLVQLELIDEKNTSFASSRFREANIFVPHSDGNTLVSFAEGVDLVGMIWSGLKINTKLRAQLIRDCLGGRAKVRGSTQVSVSCAAASYRRTFPKVGVSMPEHIRFINNLNTEMWNNYIGNVFKAAGYVPNSKGLASLDDISLSPHVMQYVEMIYARFDANDDDYISTEEAIKAFPAFKGVMLELAQEQLKNGTIKEDELVDVFGFILRFGHPPTSISEKLRYLFNWKGKSKSWDIWAGRTQLSEILGYIADEVSKATQNKRPVKMDFNLEVSERR